MIAQRSHTTALRHAFTLIELIMVMMIVAILAAAAAPRYQAALAHHRVNAAAGRIAADLRMVRAYARKASSAQDLQFNVAADAYVASSMPDMNGRNVAYQVSLGSSEYVTDVTAADFGGATYVQFDIYGRPHASGTVVVRSGTLERIVQLDEAGNVSIL